MLLCVAEAATHQATGHPGLELQVPPAGPHIIFRLVLASVYRTFGML
jgi:hypothetical protein